MYECARISRGLYDDILKFRTDVENESNMFSRLVRTALRATLRMSIKCLVNICKAQEALNVRECNKVTDGKGKWMWSY